MGLDQVIGDVRRDGEERAQAVLQKARQEADAILGAAREKARQYEAERMAAAERDAAQRQAQALSRAESEARKAVLTAEAELRTQLREAALKAFADLPDKARAAHLKALVHRAKAIIPDGEVFGAERDAKALGSMKEYRHGGSVPIAGGIVVESAGGDARLDLSYETLLDEMWRDVLRSEAGLFA